jgi:hypothetical protein
MSGRFLDKLEMAVGALGMAAGVLAASPHSCLSLANPYILGCTAGRKIRMPAR